MFDYNVEATIQARVATAGTVGQQLRGSVSMSLQDGGGVEHPKPASNFYGLAENSATFFFSDASQTFGRMNDIVRSCISVPEPTEVFIQFGFRVLNDTDPNQQVTFELISAPKFTLIKELPETV
ncbi:hypothetical protein [Yoonia maricola]|uniref:hypothetical protein n=1 Tax=Yoonia maricola TaxID=420999 RepID=UPI000C239D45|nr:hypothetical protein [Yoonia maricola]